jgi:hypothetical protein
VFYMLQTEPNGRQRKNSVPAPPYLLSRFAEKSLLSGNREAESQGLGLKVDPYPKLGAPRREDLIFATECPEFGRRAIFRPNPWDSASRFAGQPEAFLHELKVSSPKLGGDMGVQGRVFGS